MYMYIIYVIYHYGITVLLFGNIVIVLHGLGESQPTQSGSHFPDFSDHPIAAFMVSWAQPGELVSNYGKWPIKNTIWLFNIGKPSISMGHLYHGYVTNNQRVDELKIDDH